MKSYFFYLFLSGWLLLGGLAAQAQPTDQVPPIRAALAEGSSRSLAQYLAPSVEVGFDGDKQSYNVTQAELVLRSFFTKNPPTSFRITHQGASNEGIPYYVGAYVSRSTTYQVFIKLKAKTSTPVIDSLDFTKQ